MPRLCDDYLSLYCQAAGNIRENTGDTVPEATLRLLVNKMLEEVGAQCTRERQNGVCSVLSVSSVLEFLSPTLFPGSAWLPEGRVGVSLWKGELKIASPNTTSLTMNDAIFTVCMHS